MVGFIYGALAATMSTLLMGMNVGEQEYMLKMSSIKGWMRAKDLSKGDMKKILNYYRAKNKVPPRPAGTAQTRSAAFSAAIPRACEPRC